jgi:hypothetical protein
MGMLDRRVIVVVLSKMNVRRRQHRREHDRNRTRPACYVVIHC